jgi:hypothetical protein
MTANLGEGPAEGRERTPAQIAHLRDIEKKIDELKAVESRLGTPLEQAGDLDRAQELAHRVNNLLTTYRLTWDLRDSAADI